MKEYGAKLDWWQEKIEYPKTNLFQLHFVHKKSHLLAWNRTRASEMSDQQITAWATARPYDVDDDDDDDEEEEEEE